MDYDTAKAQIVSQDQAAVMQAFMQGKIKIEGDMAKVLTLATEDRAASGRTGAGPGDHRRTPADHGVGAGRATEPEGAAAPAAAGEHCLSYAAPSGPASR